MLKLIYPNSRDENIKIVVPKGIRYISDWEDYSLSDPIFQTPHILNKKIPGCGYTEYCLRSRVDLILCSPRKMLLSNKESQHSNEVFYFKNELESSEKFDRDLIGGNKANNKIVKKSASSIYSIIKAQEQKTLFRENLKRLRITLENDLKNYIMYCEQNNLPKKILVTYDSFKVLKDVLNSLGIFDKFYTVIDEFQSILVDSRFKASTELEFLSQLQGNNKVCFVSATPMMDKYLKQLDEFKDLPYYELDWISEDETRAKKSNLKIKYTKSISTKAKCIIFDYLNNKFEISTKIDREGNLIHVQSKEVVFYINSVSNIVNIIKDTGLKADQVNILCANTVKNKSKIRKVLGSSFSDLIDDSTCRIPKKGEPHKMFTFCTRTVYLGADFYSTCARTIVLSDANIESLAVDIYLDLPQILGRQRLDENPWKNRAEFYYKNLPSDYNIAATESEKIIENKIKETETLLSLYNNNLITEEERSVLLKKLKFCAENQYYLNDYISVNNADKNNPFPVFNKLVYLSDIRAFEIQQIDYKNRVSVINSILTNNFDLNKGNSIQEFIKEFENQPNLKEKIKFICTNNSINNELKLYALDQIDIIFKNIYETVGPEKCRALSYNYSDIKKELNNIINFSLCKIDVEIKSKFKIGDCISLSDTKRIIQNLYDNYNIDKIAKASEIERFFVTKRIKIKDDNGKFVHGYKILGLI